MSYATPFFDAGQDWSAEDVRNLYSEMLKEWLANVTDPGEEPTNDDLETLEKPNHLLMARSGSDYMPIVGSFGQVLWHKDLGRYSGSTIALIGSETRFGILIFGWGSCGGCDALESRKTWQEVADLRRDVARGIRWFHSAQDILRYVREHDWTLEWTWALMKDSRIPIYSHAFNRPSLSWHVRDALPLRAQFLQEMESALIALVTRR